MGSQSGLLKRREIERQRWTEVAQRVTQQYMMDTLQLTMHSEYGWGHDRLMDLCAKWRKTISEYAPSQNARDPECDVYREHMDRALVQIMRNKGELIPWDKRYPELNKVRY